MKPVMSIIKTLNKDSAVDELKASQAELLRLYECLSVLKNKKAPQCTIEGEEFKRFFSYEVRRDLNDEKGADKLIKALKEFYDESLTIRSDSYDFESSETKETNQKEKLVINQTETGVNVKLTFNLTRGGYTKVVDISIAAATFDTEEVIANKVKIAEKAIEAFKRRIDQITDVVISFEMGLYVGDVQVTIE